MNRKEDEFADFIRIYEYVAAWSALYVVVVCKFLRYNFEIEIFFDSAIYLWKIALNAERCLFNTLNVKNNKKLHIFAF